LSWVGIMALLMLKVPLWGVNFSVWSCGIFLAIQRVFSCSRIYCAVMCLRCCISGMLFTVFCTGAFIFCSVLCTALHYIGIVPYCSVLNCTGTIFQQGVHKVCVCELSENCCVYVYTYWEPVDV
jgi:hypothetical protein